MNENIIIDEKCKLQIIDKEKKTRNYLILSLVSFITIPYILIIADSGAKALDYQILNFHTFMFFFYGAYLGLIYVLAFYTPMIKIETTIRKRLTTLIDKEEKKDKKQIVFFVILALSVIGALLSIIIGVIISLKNFETTYDFRSGYLGIFIGYIFMIVFLALLIALWYYQSKKNKFQEIKEKIIKEELPVELFVSLKQSYKLRITISIVLLIIGLHCIFAGYLLLFAPFEVLLEITHPILFLGPLILLMISPFYFLYLFKYTKTPILTQLKGD